ncbi:MAG: cellulose biosynthesis [Frankiales bacterium]|nr:cellulose biosynthesis [Frankiales bacterium]
MRLDWLTAVDDPVLQASWEELAESSKADPWTWPGWTGPWWRWFGTGHPMVAILRASSGRVIALAPFEQAGSRLRSTTNWHTPGFQVIAESTEARRELVERVVAAWDGAVTMQFLSDSDAVDVTEAAARRRARYLTRVLESSPVIPLASGWSAYERTLDKHLRSELRRRTRRLSERGEVEFHVSDGSTDLESRLAEVFRVEAAGWKGAEGSAIGVSPATRGFYTAMARWASDRGWLRLCSLRVDNQAIACDLSIEKGGSHHLLKTGYDEAFAAFAPGKLLRAEVLHRCFACNALRSYEFGGVFEPWKRDWASQQRSLIEVRTFTRTPLGRAEWAVQARARPLARAARDRLWARSTS